MKLTRFGTTSLVLAAGAVLLAGCGSTDDSAEPTASPSASATPSDSATPTPGEESSENTGDESAADEAGEKDAEPQGGEVSYTDPSEGADFCAVLDDMITMNDEAASQSEEASVAQLGARLDIMVSTTERLAEFSPSADDAAVWKEVAAKYTEARDLYKSSGEQIANDGVIGALAEAAVAQNDAFAAQGDSMEQECGTDLSALIPAN